ncbi:MAG: hypothetical protein EOO68_09505 [Moraxellaceae bacterium]|nr:MAG: hypothetical protein EOO68_09505 [Moraxellaceae bacterium]
MSISPVFPTDNNVAMTSTLHQITHAPRYWGHCVEQIMALWQPTDELILLGEAAQGYADARLDFFDQVYLLNHDADLLGLVNNDTRYHLIDYAQWAQLVLKHQRHISWK